MNVWVVRHEEVGGRAGLGDSFSSSVGDNDLRVVVRVFRPVSRLQLPVHNFPSRLLGAPTREPGLAQVRTGTSGGEIERSPKRLTGCQGVPPDWFHRDTGDWNRSPETEGLRGGGGVDPN